MFCRISDVTARLRSTPGTIPPATPASIDPGLGAASDAKPANEAGAQGTYLQTSRLANFRSCYDTTVQLQPTLTLLVGENNSGKSDVIEAIRLATAPLNLRRTSRWSQPRR